MAGAAGERAPFDRVAIMGLGLMGGSLGLALRARRAAAEVVGWNRSEAPALRALATGAVDRVAASPEEAARGADVVVVAAPVGCVVEIVQRVAASLPPAGVVTDVGSVKVRIVAQAGAALPGRFVGGHPMAGSEESGISSACADLYVGAPWVLTPVEGTGPDAVERVSALVRSVGARPLLLPPEVHDRCVAAVSHLPHMAAYALAATVEELAGPDGVAIAAGSYRDGTRVASSDPSLWTGILLDNRDAVLDALERLGAWLTGAGEALRAGDGTRLEGLLRDARSARQRGER